MINTCSKIIKNHQKSPPRELEIERELSHELRDDLLFLDAPIFIKFDFRKCNFATIRGYAILRECQRASTDNRDISQRHISQHLFQQGPGSRASRPPTAPGLRSAQNSITPNGREITFPIIKFDENWRAQKK